MSHQTLLQRTLSVTVLALLLAWLCAPAKAMENTHPRAVFEYKVGDSILNYNNPDELPNHLIVL